MISPILEQLSDTAELSKVQFYKVDVDEAEEISQDQGIKAVSTSLYIYNISLALMYVQRVDANLSPLQRWQGRRGSCWR